MENASQALIMAASIILGVLLFSVFVYVFRAGASVDETYDAAQIVRQMNLFNSYFEVYDRNDNTIMDIITVANRAYSVNKDVDYDNTQTIKIVVEIGNKHYVIPDEEPPIPAEEENRFGRNKIFNGNADGTILNGTNSFSIYDLVEIPIKDLGISLTDRADTDKLSTAKLGNIQYYSTDDVEKTRSNATVYKYVFERTDMEYNLSSGRIKSMKFRAVKNPNWDL